MNDNSSTNKKRVNIRDDGSELASEPRNDGRERSGERVLTRKAKLLWVEAEDSLSPPFLRALFDGANAQVPVLHRAGEVAFLVRGLHQVSHAFRDTAFVDHSLRAPADA